MNDKIAVFPGSFSPFTLGHQYVINRAMALFDKIIIAVGSNSSKEYYFTEEQRIQWMEDIFKDEPKVEIRKYEGLTVDFCKSIGANFILRGLRNSKDFNYEKEIAQVNQTLNEEIETIFIITSSEYSHISSTLVREVAKNGGDISKFVPKGIKI
ncbi:MAG: pantetheine-phosphate adenylyltransferase [Flavobacteriales bacterium]|jgi:pantetheine-phosphate adenylyltransferase|tara:strand:- start:255 stop:716 length:462 start_codon:yes stop_codon:yes gene_type:complete